MNDFVTEFLKSIKKDQHVDLVFDINTSGYDPKEIKEIIDQHKDLGAIKIKLNQDEIRIYINPKKKPGNTTIMRDFISESTTVSSFFNSF